MPPELTGYWVAGPHAVAVRTEPRWMTFEFTRDPIRYTMALSADKTASGTIGRAVFRDVPVEKNGGEIGRRAALHDREGHVSMGGMIFYKVEPVPDH